METTQISEIGEQLDEFDGYEFPEDTSVEGFSRHSETYPLLPRPREVVFRSSNDSACFNVLAKYVLARTEAFTRSFSIVADPVQLGRFEDIISPDILWPSLYRPQESAVTVEPAKGSVPMNYERQILFRKTIRLKTAELPRWRPQVTAVSGPESDDDE